MFESTPVVKVVLELNIRLPHCAACYIELEVVSHVGLTLNRCSFKFTAMSTRHELMWRAVRTAGSNSRILVVSFRTFTSADLDGSFWDGYRQPDIRVGLTTHRVS